MKNKSQVVRDTWYYILRIVETQKLLNDAKSIARFYMTHGYDENAIVKSPFYSDILKRFSIKYILPKLYKDIRFLKQKIKDYNYLLNFARDENCAEIAYFPILLRDSIPEKIKEIEKYLNRLYEERWRAFNYINRELSGSNTILYLAKIHCGYRSFLVSSFTPKEEIVYKISLAKENPFVNYRDSPLDILRQRWQIE